MKRAGRHTILRIRRERMALLRKHWRRHVGLAALLAALAGVSMILLPPLMRAFLAGVYVAMFVALVAYSLMLDGSVLKRMGAEAERWTSQALGKTAGWRVIDAMEFFDGDIDHIAVGPAQVLAVETKWTSTKVRIDGQGVHGLWFDGVEQASKAADRVTNFLASKGLHQPVTAVLILWGPGVPEVEGGYTLVGDVRVLIGRQAHEWRPRLDRMTQWSHSTAGVPEAIQTYIQEFDRRQRPTLRARALAAFGVSTTAW